MKSGSILVAGEALIDLVPVPGDEATFEAVPGGSCANVAVAIGRLGCPAAFYGCISNDGFGRRIESHLTDSGVDLGLVVRTDHPTMVATVDDEGEEPSYAFFGTAGTLDATSLPVLGDDVGAVHAGSLGLVLPGIGDAVHALVAREAGRRVISLDPNVRPALAGERDLFVRMFESLLAGADIVRASRADLAWMYPGADPADVAGAWHEAGPALAIVTDGGQGAAAIGPDGSPISVPVDPVDVVDPVGAGDAFTAGVLVGLHRRDVLERGRLRSIPPDDLRGVLAFGCRVATRTVAVRGADPPWATDVDARGQSQ